MKTIIVSIKGGMLEAIDMPLDTQIKVYEYDNGEVYTCRRNPKNGIIEEHREYDLFMEAGTKHIG